LIQLRSQIVPPEEAWLLLEQLLHRESDEYRHTGR